MAAHALQTCACFNSAALSEWCEKMILRTSGGRSEAMRIAAKKKNKKQKSQPYCMTSLDLTHQIFKCSY